MMTAGFLAMSLLIFGVLKDLSRKSSMDPRCTSAARYEVMREAYDKRRPNPCDPQAKEWVR